MTGEHPPGIRDGLLTDTKRAAIALAAIFLTHLVSGIADRRMVVGGVILFAIVIVGQGIGRLAAVRGLPSLFWVAMVAMVTTWPGVPGAEFVRDALGGIGFLAVITPLMAFAALGLTGQDIRLFRQAGARFFAISLLVFLGTFLGSALIAQAVFKLTGT